MLHIPNLILPSDHAFRENANAHSIRMSASFDKLDQQTQRIVSSVLESNRTVSREITTALSQLMRRLEVFNKERHIHIGDGQTENDDFGMSPLPVSQLRSSCLLYRYPKRPSYALEYKKQSSKIYDIQQCPIGTKQLLKHIQKLSNGRSRIQRRTNYHGLTCLCG
jgi:hypothetical protein